MAQKNTVSDNYEIEHENESSVFSSVLYTEYRDKKLNIIDAPGADDFIGGVVSGFRITDMALMLINAQNGVEVGTKIHSRFVERDNKPMMLVVNQCDHDKANFEKTFESIRERFGGNAVMVNYPAETGKGFDTLIDVLGMKMMKYTGEKGKPETREISGDHKDRATELHNELVEKAAESDEALMETFFEKETLNEEELGRGIRNGLLQQGIIPVFFISAAKNIGVDVLMEFLATNAPSPDQFPPAKTVDGKDIKPDSGGPASVFVFKSSVESHIGEINYFKVMSGRVTEGMDLINQTTNNKERFTQLFVSAGKNRTRIPSLAAGDIGATVKLKSTRTNHSLSAPGSSLEYPPAEFPEPKYRTAIKPLNEGDEEKLSEALSRMQEEDPTILVEYSKELKQIIVSGQGEYHLNILKWHLDNVFKLETEFVPPKIPYRETITKIARADYRHKKQSGGAGQFGEVHMVIEPYSEGMPDPTVYKIAGRDIKVSARNKEELDLPWGGKLVFLNCIVGGSIDSRFMPAILKGIMEKMEEGPLTGSYARDIRVAVYDGKMHPVDSNEISFKLAGRNAFREAFKNAGPKILEPIYDVEVLVPPDKTGDVMSDLQGRRAIVQGMSSEKGFEKLRAKVPLAEMDKYSTALSSLTNGRAIYTMKFSEYLQVSPDVQEQLLRAYEQEQEEE